MSLIVMSLTKMTECVSHCERNCACNICQKIWFWLPQNTPWCKLSSCNNVSATKMCVASPARETAHLPLSANVNNAKPLQPNAFLAPGLCQIRANTHKQKCHLQSRMLHKYMNAACRSNIRVQHNETDFVKYELEQTQISNTYCQITTDHHYWL